MNVEERDSTLEQDMLDNMDGLLDADDEDMDDLLGSQGQGMGELLDSMAPIKPVRRGDVVEGVVMRADADGIFVNI